MSTVAEKLKAASLALHEAGVDNPTLDAQLLMARAISGSRLDVIVHPERKLSDSEIIHFDEMLSERVCRKPLAYILGSKEFYGLCIEVAPGVLIPRPETEILVEETINRIKSNSPLIADVGVGSGAISVALAKNIENARIYAVDISEAALSVTARNVEKHSVSERVKILYGNLLEPLKSLNIKFDAIVSNPPYIPSNDISSLEPEVRLYEPREALDGGFDGLDIYRNILPEAINYLADEGFIAVEMGAGQASYIEELAKEAGYSKISIIRDYAGIERIQIAYK